MKVWVSKYALSRGIYEAEGTLCDEPATVFCPTDGSSRYLHGQDWHHERAHAEIKASVMKAKKLAALKTEIARINNLTFTLEVSTK